MGPAPSTPRQRLCAQPTPALPSQAAAATPASATKIAAIYYN